MELTWSKYSGYQVMRRKFPGIDHPGIVLGSDREGMLWVVHNQIDAGRPILEPLSVFSADGITDFRPSANPAQAVWRAWRKFQRAEPYDIFAHNCQHFVSEALTGRRQSTALQALSVLAVGAAFLYYAAQQRAEQ